MQVARRARHHPGRRETVEALALRSRRAAESFVPALAGLGAPIGIKKHGRHHRIDARHTAAHLARATLEGIAFQVRDLVDAIRRCAGLAERLRVDGGAASNDFLMQFQADVAGVTVQRPADIVSTGRGAAMLAGIGAGLFQTLDEVAGAPSRVSSSRGWPRTSAANICGGGRIETSEGPRVGTERASPCNL